MKTSIYRYTFAPDVPIEEVEASMVLALFAAESLHGESQVQLDAEHCIEGKTCVIDAGTPVGQDINRLFIGFLRREFDPTQFTVARVNGAVAEQAQAA